jgi:hypothetical protein
MANLNDINSIGNGPNGSTNLNLNSSAISFQTNSTNRLTLSNTITVGPTVNSVSTLFYLNGSSSLPIITASYGSGNIVLDLSTANNFEVHLTNTTVLSTINPTIGQKGTIFLVQPTTGNVAVTFSSFKWASGITPNTTITANAVDGISYTVGSNGVSAIITAIFTPNYS